MINPKFWNSKFQRAEPPDKENTLINQQLSLIENKIYKVFYCFKFKKKVLNFNKKEKETNFVYQKLVNLML